VTVIYQDSSSGISPVHIKIQNSISSSSKFFS